VLVLSVKSWSRASYSLCLKFESAERGRGDPILVRRVDPQGHASRLTRRHPSEDTSTQAAMAEGWARDKVLKEAFVSGLAGGSLYEISVLTAVGLVLPPPKSPENS
jgi:hypothetical protein